MRTQFFALAIFLQASVPPASECAWSHRRHLYFFKPPSMWSWSPTVVESALYRLDGARIESSRFILFFSLFNSGLGKILLFSRPKTNKRIERQTVKPLLHELVRRDREQTQVRGLAGSRASPGQAVDSPSRATEESCSTKHLVKV